MKKLFIYSVMIMGVFALSGCGKEEKKEEEAATLFKLPTQREAFYGESVKIKPESEEEAKSERMKAFGF